MRDVVFLVADATMQQTLQDFFGRSEFHRSVGGGGFGIDARLNRGGPSRRIAEQLVTVSHTRPCLTHHGRR